MGVVYILLRVPKNSNTVQIQRQREREREDDGGSGGDIGWFTGTTYIIRFSYLLFASRNYTFYYVFPIESFLVVTISYFTILKDNRRPGKEISTKCPTLNLSITVSINSDNNSNKWKTKTESISMTPSNTTTNPPLFLPL